MTINRNNYEVFIIDYFDGKLSPVESAELLFFISQNPELEEEFNLFEHVNLPIDESEYYGKNNLRKDFKDIETITDINFEEFCIAYSEGLLDKASEGMLFRYLEKNSEKKRDFELYQKVFLKPDKELIFPHKKLLKHQKSFVLKISTTFLYLGAAAAMILMALLINIFQKQQQTVLTSEVMPDKLNGENKPVIRENIEPGIKNEIIAVKKSLKPVVTSGSKITDKIIESKPEMGENRLNSDNDYIVLNPIKIVQLDYPRNPTSLTPSVKSNVAKKTEVIEYLEDNSLRNMLVQKVTSNDNLNLWTLAEASVKGINYLTESDVKISRKMNDAGKMTNIVIDLESFGISAPFK